MTKARWLAVVLGGLTLTAVLSSQLWGDGKGQKDRFVPLNNREIAAMQTYIEKGRPKLAAMPDNNLLFIGRRGKQMTRQRIWQVFTELSQRVLGRAVSTHKFRHAFVTDTINGGAEARVVQHMAGHAYVSTTMRYMHSDLERVRTLYLKFHPRELES